MPQTLLINNHSVEVKQPCVMRHCKSCFREDYHRDLAVSPFLRGFLMVLTLGLISFVRPGRCVCCGNLRLF